MKDQDKDNLSFFDHLKKVLGGDFKKACCQGDLESAALQKMTSTNKNLPDNLLTVCWYGEPIGHMYVDKDSDEHFSWAGFTKPEYRDIFYCRPRDGMPHFLVNLHPDSYIFTDELDQASQVEYVENGLRFLSNLTISRNAPFDHPVMLDAKLARTPTSADGSTFSGTYTGPKPKLTEDEDFAATISPLWGNRHMPRFSGAEIKIPVTLQKDGTLKPTQNSHQSFTHILKFPSAGGQEGWGFNEWMCLELSKAVGLETAEHHLVQFSPNQPPACLVERFDIPFSDEKSKNRLIIQDFCTLAGLEPLERSSGSIEKIAKILKAMSTNPERDTENLFKRAVLAWGVNDLDMHRKNISMLFEFDPNKKKVVRACLAPSYDITSEVHEDRPEFIKQTLTINGKTSGLKKSNFIAMGISIGLTSERAETLFDKTLRTAAARSIEICQNMPAIARDQAACAYTAKRIATIVSENTKSMGIEIPEFDSHTKAEWKTNNPGTHKTISF